MLTMLYIEEMERIENPRAAVWTEMGHPFVTKDHVGVTNPTEEFTQFLEEFNKLWADVEWLNSKIIRGLAASRPILTNGIHKETSIQRLPGSKGLVQYLNCQVYGHFARDCPARNLHDANNPPPATAEDRKTPNIE